MLLAWLCALLALTVVGSYRSVFRQLPPLFVAVLLLLVIPIAVTHAAVLRFPCPRCRMPFFKRTPWRGSVLTRRCAHCGLPKWSAAAVSTTAGSSA
jgi:hypothetical protein